ncbi:MAG: hypothetical protein ACI9VT_003788 [Psychroserpens sp.]|jgi:hypothetical protein
MKLTQLFLCSATLALPLTLNAATQKSDDRWFDVEIIIFSHLGDKSQLKESFPDTSVLPKHRRVEDLLRRYLNPDIRSLKQLLPSCDSPQYGEHLVKKTAKLPPIFNEKSLVELAFTATEASKLNLVNRSAEQNNSQFSDSSNSLYNNALSAEPELTAEERAKNQRLLLAVEAEIQTLKFKYTPRAEAKLLCRIEQTYFADYQINTPEFDYYSFIVDKVPLLIDGKEEIGNNKTHLLSNESLQLNDVIQDLRYSKDFRPLLHMGWRQVARAEKDSIPVKVYAGENFAADHKKKLAHYNEQKNQQIAQTLRSIGQQSPVGILTVQNQAKSSQEKQAQAAQEARIKAIIAQLSTVNEDTEALIASIEAQNLSLKFSNDNPLLSSPPLAPVQPWFLDGFFNIHLKHYLFITADFNILDKSLVELTAAQLAENVSAMGNAESKIAKPIQAKAIRFQQDRRVISGEVHYFDHPYFGMIVQIRPYTMPEPEDEDEENL